jgi:uncharacterized protein
MVFWRAVDGAISVAVKVQPRSRRPELHGPSAQDAGPQGVGLHNAQPQKTKAHDTKLRNRKLHHRRPQGGLPDADNERLTIAVREPPEDGRANRAACAALAAAVGVPPSYVEVASGATSRRKTLLVSGDATAIAVRLAAL